MKFTFRKIESWPGLEPGQWLDWHWQVKNVLSTPNDFERYFDLSPGERTVLARSGDFPVRATPYYVSLADKSDVRDVVRQMVVPGRAEWDSRGQQIADPLGEREHSPVARLIHRYPDRVLFLVTDQCSLYCRYCLRKHFTGQGEAFIGSSQYEAALNYIRAAPGVREVILSGGDPLTLGDGRMERLLFDLRAISHVEIIRIASRMPVVCPMRITNDLVSLFRRFKPVLFMTHFNHPRELSADAAESLERLVDGGVPVFNQMVLLNGINNHAAIVQALSRRLLYLRVKPYYMFQCDPSEGSEHFRTSIQESEEIQREMWGRLSGLAMPSLSLDIPGGGGKVGLVPEFEVTRDHRTRRYSGFDGRPGDYAQPTGARIAPPDVDVYLPEWKEIVEQRYGKK